MSEQEEAPKSSSQDQKPPTQYAHAKIAVAHLSARGPLGAHGNSAGNHSPPETAESPQSQAKQLSKKEFLQLIEEGAERARQEMKERRIRRGYDMVEGIRLACGFMEFTQSAEPGISYTTEILVLLGSQAEQIEELSAQLVEARKMARQAQAELKLRRENEPEGAE